MASEWTTDRIEALLQGITEPPWEIDERPEAVRNTVYGVGYIVQFESHNTIFIPDSGGAMFDSQEIRANMLFVIAAPEIIRWLLDENAELKKKVCEALGTTI